MKVKVKVKFRDTEFGLFEPSFTVPVLGSAGIRCWMRP